jgi:hypothetical protein
VAFTEVFVSFGGIARGMMNGTTQLSMLANKGDLFLNGADAGLTTCKGCGSGLP